MLMIIILKWKHSGRIKKAVTLKAEETCFNIVNIYDPTKDKVSDQLEFLKLLDSNLDLAEAQFIIGGDFKTYLDPILDKESGKP